MDRSTAAALISGVFVFAAAVLVFISSRRANKTSSDADIRKWADSLLVTVQQTQREMEQVRKEAHALADELREVRREAWREDSMPRFREWLSRRPDPDASPMRG
ncbi:MAG: hypothetical protein JWO11_4439 [Nocardioides sp.]|nr:hypothetical protein [Nocardioides sp.]